MVFPQYVWITYYVGELNSSGTHGSEGGCPGVNLHQYFHGVLAMDSTVVTTSTETRVCMELSLEVNQ